MDKWEIAVIMSAVTINLQGLRDPSLPVQIEAIQKTIEYLEKAADKIQLKVDCSPIYQKGVRELLNKGANV